MNGFDAIVQKSMNRDFRTYARSGVTVRVG